MISIHASLREATFTFDNFYTLWSYFNSRLSTRGYEILQAHHCDWKFQLTPLYERLLSEAQPSLLLLKHFNSRLSTRGYIISSCQFRNGLNFNSRLSTRGYEREPPQYGHRTNFNSRLSTRGYSLIHELKGYRAISIHASLREATYSAMGFA